MYCWVLFVLLDTFLTCKISNKNINVGTSVRPSVQKKIQARVLKFHIWIPRQNSLHVFFILSELSPLAELCPFEGLNVQICNHDISITITARSFKLGQLLEDNE